MTRGLGGNGLNETEASSIRSATSNQIHSWISMMNHMENFNSNSASLACSSFFASWKFSLKNFLQVEMQDQIWVTKRKHHISRCAVGGAWKPCFLLPHNPPNLKPYRTLSPAQMVTCFTHLKSFSTYRKQRGEKFSFISQQYYGNIFFVEEARITNYLLKSLAPTRGSSLITMDNSVWTQQYSKDTMGWMLESHL